jgi:diguanylate cyclase (GGDEF)-like protein
VQIESDQALYLMARAAVSVLWILLAVGTARFARQLEGRNRLLARLGAALLALPALESGLDAWDNVVGRGAQPIPHSSWFWLLFDGLAPVFGLSLLRALAERDAAHAALRALATMDPLTGLTNRRGFLEAAPGIIASARRQGLPVSLMLLDLDHFKAVNDGFGHEAGDEVLRRAATVLRATLRRGDLAVRWGGEEFAALLPAADERQAVALAERVRAALRAEVPHPAGGAAAVTASLGIAALDGCGVEAAVAEQEALNAALRAADHALYEAKTRGRDRVVVAAGTTAPLSPAAEVAAA